MTGSARTLVQDRRRLQRERPAGSLGTESGSDVVADVMPECNEPAASWREPVDPPVPRLTPREVEVVRSMADGLSTGQIATRLGIANKSVDNHRQRVYAKLGARNSAHAVALGADCARATDDRTTVVAATPSGPLRDVLGRAFDDVDDVDVLAAVTTVADLLAWCVRYPANVVLAGTSFPDGALIEVLSEILRGGARVLVIADASAGAMEAVFPLLFAGASGCLLVPDVGPAQIVAATRQVAAGNASLHPAAAAAVLRQWRDVRSTTCDRLDSPSAAAVPPHLTAREADVLAALARGLPTKSIGRELTVSPKTVEAHIARLLAKLGARNRAHAVSVALGCGLLDRSDMHRSVSQVIDGDGAG